MLLTKVKIHVHFCIKEILFDTGEKYSYYAKCLVLKYFLLKEKSYLSQVCYMCLDITSEHDPSERNCLYGNFPLCLLLGSCVQSPQGSLLTRK